MFFGDFSAWTTGNILIRLIASAFIGLIIGLDRSTRHQGAGTKTISVVCLSSTLVALLEQYIQIAFPGTGDMSRLAAQVISGVGFLGVGTIIVANHRVRGLTTAATLWASACLGLATGFGFVDVAIFVAILILIVIHLGPRVENLMFSKTNRYFSMIIDLKSLSDIKGLTQVIKAGDLKIETLEVMKGKSKGLPVSLYITLYSDKRMSDEEILEILTEDEKVLSVEFL